MFLLCKSCPGKIKDDTGTCLSCARELQAKLDVAILQIQEYRKALEQIEKMEKALGPSALLIVQACQAAREALSEKPKCSLTKPLGNGETCVLEIGHRGPCNHIALKRVAQPQFFCEKCHYIGPVEYPHPRFEGIETEFCLERAKPRFRE